jgi:acylphosphatase
MKTIRAKISGTVQGVFFRKFIKENAEKLGLRGHVRNLEGSQIEVIAEGRDEAVNEMMKVCKQGAPHSIVKDVVLQELNHIGFDDFKILSV